MYNWEMTKSLLNIGLALVIVVVEMSYGFTKEPEITVAISQIHSEKGKVSCAIWNSKEGFPKDVSISKSSSTVPIKNGNATCKFHVLPGTYAVAVYHDENDNGQFDTNWLGIPLEGHGASNDAQGHMGPPHFEDAQFNYVGGDLSLQLTMHY